MGEVDAEDVAMAQASLSWNADPNVQVPAQVALSSVARNGRGCWLEVYGSDGSLVLGSENQKDYVHGFNLWHARAGEAPRSVQADPDWHSPPPGAMAVWLPSHASNAGGANRSVRGHR